MREDLMTISQAAEYLGVSESYLYRRVDPPKFKLGRRNFYKQEALDAYIDAKARMAIK